MKPKLVLALLALVLVPLCLLGWLGVRSSRDQREIVQHRYQELLLGKLVEIDAAVVKVMAGLERRFLRETEFPSYDPAPLRAYVRNAPVVGQVFVLDPEGSLIHPSPEGEPSTAEEAFLARTHDIWQHKLIPNQPTGEGPAEQQGRSTWQTKGSKESGWFTWYWGSGINLIFWRRDPSGMVVGVELDRVRLLADIVGELPETDSLDPSTPDGLIALVDSASRIVYQWGNHEPQEDEAPRVSLPLRYPLNAWRLDYYVSPELFDASTGKDVTFSLVSGLFVVGIGLAALAVYFYRESSRELREAAQRVSFVNQVSHELKTPLTSIRMYAELLENQLADQDEKPRRHLDIIVSESQRLSRLIGNILTFGRSQRKKLRLHMTPGIVDEVIHTVLDRFRLALESKEVDVEFSGDAGAEVSFDADALEQILGNLFNNVEKYAASGRMMQVTSRQDGDITTITVSDRGPGIPESQRDRIFQPFYRLSDRLSDGVTGTGIGLSISRELARLHGGDLVLDPGTPGATFRVTLRTPNVKGEPVP